ncbi:hypothetical protein DWG18_10415 [Lysobacter sp. TY2-98]|uniref:hypothetical protein n=1 Tax=Lysobacter sp. TY2-98 TaxID=2290922 RepID=UPI000E206504|nr:hypothetical protein [Lysobacter sp. TY2-98]AXK72643.1 hypothetical protein DWG18_10415 [Lysobacter sp. TY2-98]
MRRALASAALMLWLGLAPAVASDAPAATDPLAIPAAEQRTGDQTFLTFPEWFLVFSPDEYADMLEAHQSPSRFPFYAHIAQFWQAYGRVIDSVRGRWPFNGEYHTMIMVIGASTTVEYGLKGTYETLIGRLSELGTAPLSTPEDRLAAKQARDYVEFVRVRPWYEFDFMTPLKSLWRDTPATGPHLVRKWERRYLLTSEWLIKAGYAALIEKATHTAFKVAKPTTATVIDAMPDNLAALPEMHVDARVGTAARVDLPRYQAFTPYATSIARAGGTFREIAGNRGDLLVSVVMPQTSDTPTGTRLLFRQPILTRPGYERRALVTSVFGLAPLLAEREAAGDEVEHVFDY